jgi:hypothetical protein
MSEISKLIADIKSEGILRAGNKLEQLYSMAEQMETDHAALQQELDAAEAKIKQLEWDSVFIPKNIESALAVVGMALPESKEEFNFQINRWIQRLVDRVVRLGPELDAERNNLRAEGLKMAIDHMNNQTSDDCADVTVLPVMEMYKKLISGTHDTADKAG